MSKTPRIYAFILSCFACLSWGPVCAKEQKITLVFAADMPRIDAASGTFAHLNTILNQTRAKPTPSFFFFGGGSIGPSPMSSFDNGSHIIDILNSLEPDAMGVNKREFSYAEDNLSLRAYEAAFPIVASNITDNLSHKSLDGLVKHSMVTRQGVKIGVLSIIDSSIIDDYLMHKINVDAPRSTLEVNAAYLRSQGADIVVLLYSGEFDFIETLLDEHVIDLGLLSDPHFDLVREKRQARHMRNIHLGNFGQAAIADITWQKGKHQTLTIDWRTQALNELKPDPAIDRILNDYVKRLNRILDQPLAKTSNIIDTNLNVVRATHSNFANLIADVMKYYTSAQLSLVNGGTIRGEKVYPKGTLLTRRDIAIELPFQNKVVSIEVTGKQLYAALENGFSMIESLKGRFPHVSGMLVHYDKDAPVGERVLKVEIKGEAIDLNKKYSLATTNFIANGGDGYHSFAGSKVLPKTNRISPVLSEMVFEAIRDKEQLTLPTDIRLIDKQN